ncbi:MAG: hypothetical protein M3018_13865 [Actinomycetota bacterium]|nr:hypothetical protein [Actinomycetota bacterium]
MKSIDGRANSEVSASAEECFALLAAVHGYPTWIGELVRAVDVLEWDAADRPTTARMAIHVARGPLVKDFEVVVSVQAKPVDSVLLARLKHEPSDREELEISWQLHSATGTGIEVSFHALTPEFPRFVPVRGVGDEIADTLLRAAVRALDPSDN